MGKVKIADAELNLQALPLAALLNATWILVLIVGLQYCQATIRVNRQYPYLHSIEEAVSPAVGGGDLYQREGKVYLREYPLLLDMAWFIYGVFFPMIVMCACLWLVILEWADLPYPLLHRIFDVLMALTIVTVFFVYRVQPVIASRWKMWQTREQRSEHDGGHEQASAYSEAPET